MGSSGAGVAGDTVVLEYMQRGQLAAASPDVFPVLHIASVMQVPAGPAAQLTAPRSMHSSRFVQHGLRTEKALLPIHELALTCI